MTVKRVEPDGIVLTNNTSAIVKLYFAELPKEVQERFHYDPQKGDEYSRKQNEGQEQLRKQQEEAQRKAQEETERKNKQAGEELSASEAAQGRREKIQRLQARYQELEQQESDLRLRIQEAERLPRHLYGRSGSKSYAVPNPARQYIPDWQTSLNDVRHEKDQVKKELEQAQH